jgi:hypothetical protein
MSYQWGLLAPRATKRNQRGSHHPDLLFYVAAIAAVAGLIWLAETKRDWQKQAEAEAGMIRREASVNAIRLRHNAAVVRIDPLGQQFTAHVQALLDRADGRPVLIRGSLDDVLRSDHGYVAVVTEGAVMYRLRCTEAIAGTIGKPSPSLYAVLARVNSYAVVARITGVRPREKPGEGLEEWIAEGDWLEGIECAEP